MPDRRVPLQDLPRAHRVAITELVRDALTTLRELAALYGTFAALSTLPPLRAALEELAQAKAAHVAALEAFARATDAVSSALGRDLPPPPTPQRPPHAPGGGGPSSVAPIAPHLLSAVSGDSRGAAFGLAFRGERALEVVYRELAPLLEDPGMLPMLPRLSAETAHHRARLRELYLKYS